MSDKKKKKQNLDEGMIMLSPMLPVGGVHGLGGMKTKADNFEFKGLPGQFNEDGEKVLDEQGQPIAIKETILKNIKEYINSKEDKKEAANELIKAIKSHIS